MPEKYARFGVCLEFMLEIRDDRRVRPLPDLESVFAPDEPSSAAGSR